VLQKCYESVTRVFEVCYKSVTRVLQECYQADVVIILHGLRRGNNHGEIHGLKRADNSSERLLDHSMELVGLGGANSRRE
jgi:hypothetical protein